MSTFWRDYSDKFQVITPREQILVLLTGVVAISFVLYSLFIDENSMRSDTYSKDIKQIESNIKAKQQTLNIFEQALLEDPNEAVNGQIVQYENKLEQIDTALLSLTSDLINPIQMRYALIELLQLQKGVSLLAFDVIPAQPVSINPEIAKAEVSSDNQLESNKTVQPQNNTDNLDKDIPSLTLYKHGIKLTLSGNYFQLRDYLSQLEQLKWTFFWQKFDYKLKEYPQSILEVELYSLSTKKEFIGV
ncbi:hypothetical protein [Thalassotalea profundi]|uniref:MSHA biogenesis protein MshJ n=1 Tax=Thalassotalea profundi TaxID=2036687 RepID=A0ABQ3J261_9GAMM|nr:hypothetical protein [Thalassotalea profundi]GHE99089.1 MSHA biogenesis protein MshJ [Thalassotalea profundi]